MPSYSKSFKANVVKKITSPNGISSLALSKELNIPYATIRRWVRTYGATTMSENQAKANKRKSSEKLALISEYLTLDEKAKGAFLRENGLTDAHITLWTKEFIDSQSPAKTKKEKMLTHRLNAKSPSNRAKPAPLIATGINQVWTWDITYLASTVRGRFFYLYLVLDIYSRKIIGAKVHEKESADLAGFFARELAFQSGVDFGKLALHSDNGSPMKGATMLATLHELGIQRSFSRPSVSNDNPYSESMFRTLKYRPEYPDKPFETVDDAQHWVNTFVNWYNNEHRHSSLNFVTPSVRHEGDDFKELKKRAKVLEKHKQKHPERWSGEIRNCNTIGVVHLNPLKEKERNTNFLDVA